MKTKTKAMRRTTNKQPLEDDVSVSAGVDVGSPHPLPLSGCNQDVCEGPITRTNVVGVRIRQSNGIMINEPDPSVAHHQQSSNAALVTGKGKRKLDEIPVSTAAIDVPIRSLATVPLPADEIDVPSTSRVAVPLADDVMLKKLSGCGNSSLADLPDDVMLAILSRLPVKSLAYSKCVYKNWRNLVLKCWSPECLLIYCYKCVDSDTHPGTLKLTEIEGKHNQNRLLRDPFMDIPFADLFPGSLVFVVGSVNGLISLWELGDDVDNTCICNPITKEYMILPQQQFRVGNHMDLSCGFGVSLAGEHKVIRMFCQSETIKVEVYTLGTNEWRSLEVPDDINEKHCINREALIYKYNHGLYLNGHVHWVFGDQILSFDLDNETFQLFPCPTDHIETWAFQILGVLKGCLSLVVGFNVWVMKEVGIQKDWHREFDIKESFNPSINSRTWYPVCLFDGSNGKSVLMAEICKDEDTDEDEDEYEDEDENQDQERENKQLVAYCLETKTIEDTTIIDHFFTVRTYSPGYMKLQNFQSPTGVCIF